MNVGKKLIPSPRAIQSVMKKDFRFFFIVGREGEIKGKN